MARTLFQIPQEDERITLSTRYRSVLLERDYDEHTYENVEVLDRLPWLKDQEFVISGSDRMPFRVIDIRNVIALSNGREQNDTPDNRIVEVMGSKGSKYLVTIKDGHAVICTCKGFQFRQRCRHLEI